MSMETMTDHSCFDKEEAQAHGVHDEIYLNYDCYYVRRNFMIDNDEISLNE